MKTKQMEFWQGEFGAEYTARNTYSPQELDQVYLEQFGYSRSDMNREFLKGLEDSRTLEVGCNVGNQLNVLQEIGFQKLYGLELQWYAVEKAKRLTKEINIVQGSAFDLPFKDGYFDLVYTSGVLIHISPNDIHVIMDEMYRVSSKYIWGFEYYSDRYEEIVYRENNDKMWKGNFAQLFLERFPDLKVVKDQKFPYQKTSNVDQMFLLEKK
ncbi:methyltransferase type 11 [Paenibacillus sp. Soil766]|uniref:pseudaminic acid biosynthesis-associated methylase n=1 Tax=Paenibacillus sp. Soil766 TaxID=1736404 RepID=UPI00070AB311|nr:pseudaminic acid biosynthesis-associated methylase [Paenibacillus sp. Soil766]KRE97954.1 methyltransferase type 11 [Paenibacillus sp. Soil766]